MSRDDVTRDDLSALSDLRDLISVIADKAEELGQCGAALELRALAAGLDSIADPFALSRAVALWCIEARRHRGLTAFSLTDNEPLTTLLLPGAIVVRLCWGDQQCVQTLDPVSCPPHEAIDRLERLALKARNAIEEHARRNPGISRVLEWRPDIPNPFVVDHSADMGEP